MTNERERFRALLTAWDHLDHMVARAEAAHRTNPELRAVVQAREEFRSEFYDLLPPAYKGAAAARAGGRNLWDKSRKRSPAGHRSVKLLFSGEPQCGRSTQRQFPWGDQTMDLNKAVEQKAHILRQLLWLTGVLMVGGMAIEGASMWVSPTTSDALHAVAGVVLLSSFGPLVLFVLVIALAMISGRHGKG